MAMNRRNRKQLFLSASFRHFQPRKASTPPGDNGLAGGIPDNGGDNAAGGQGNPTPGSGVPASESNNAGDTFDPTSFWDSPPEDNGGAPPGESASTTTPPAGTEEKGGFAQTLTTQLQSMTFGDPIFNAEVAEQINAGNFEGVEKRFQSQLQTAVRQGLALNVQVLRPFAEQLMQQMRDEFGSTLSQRDDTDTLTRDFPAAKNPQVAPMIKQVFEQALRRTKGNRSEAVAQTKQMIALMASTTADDLQLDVAPRGAGDSRPQVSAINWLDELSGR